MVIVADFCTRMRQHNCFSLLILRTVNKVRTSPIRRDAEQKREIVGNHKGGPRKSAPRHYSGARSKRERL